MPARKSTARGHGNTKLGKYARATPRRTRAKIKEERTVLKKGARKCRRGCQKMKTKRPV